MEPLHLQLTKQIKQAVLAGKLTCGARLPSSRAMATELGISRNTAMAAIEHLKAEGYLEARQGSGTRIADVSRTELGRSTGDLTVKAPVFQHRLARQWQTALAVYHQATPDLPQPFRPGIPDVKVFPYELWNASLRRASRRLDERAAGYGDISGHPWFREVLATHLAETRGVIAEPSQILVTASARGATSLIASALLDPGDAVWVEEPGFRGPKTIFAAAGAALIPVPVDEHGITLATASVLPRPRLIYATPSHQYPTGTIMRLSRRLDLLNIAAKANAYIIEDDYDSEFQYRGRPIAALQGLDRAGCVLYVGTFSKSLLPSLRIGFIVAPKDLAPQLAQVHRNTGQLVPPVIQLAAADFIDSGQYRAHVRRMRTLYAKRLDLFAELIAAKSGGRLSATVPDGGMQTVVSDAAGIDDRVLASRLSLIGIDSHPLHDFHLQPKKANHRGVLMGFSAWNEDDARRVLERLQGRLR